MRAPLALAFIVGCAGTSAPGIRAPGIRVPGTSAGSELVYELELDLDGALQGERTALEAWLGERLIEATARVSPAGGIAVLVSSPGQRVKAEQLLRAEYGTKLEPRRCEPADGPSTICIRLSPSYTAVLRRGLVSHTVATLHARLDGRLGAIVVARGDRIVVSLPALDPEAMYSTRQLIARIGTLELKVVDNDAAYMRRVFAHAGRPEGASTETRAKQDDTWPDIRLEIESWQTDGGGPLQYDYYLAAPDRSEQVSLEEARRIDCVKPYEPVKFEGGRVRCTIEGRERLRRYLEDLAKVGPELAIPADRELGYERVALPVDDPAGQPHWRTYLLERAVEVSGVSVVRAKLATDGPMHVAPSPIVLLELDRAGTQKLAAVTSRMVGKKLAVLFEGRVESALIINTPIRDGRAAITVAGVDLAAKHRRASELARVLQAGGLRVQLREVPPSRE